MGILQKDTEGPLAIHLPINKSNLERSGKEERKLQTSD